MKLLNENWERPWLVKNNNIPLALDYRTPMKWKLKSDREANIPKHRHAVRTFQFNYQWNTTCSFVTMVSVFRWWKSEPIIKDDCFLHQANLDQPLEVFPCAKTATCKLLNYLIKCFLITPNSPLFRSYYCQKSYGQLWFLGCWSHCTPWEDQVLMKTVRSIHYVIMSLTKKMCFNYRLFQCKSQPLGGYDSIRSKHHV